VNEWRSADTCRGKVYDHLEKMINTRRLEPGEFIGFCLIVFLTKSENRALVRTVRVQRERLYDFPRRRTPILDWERSHLDEHRGIVRRLERGDFTGASDYLRDVYWSYDVQEKFIKQYYFSRMEP
jgi:DNA-binding GntR family transcriptional regulator